MTFFRRTKIVATLGPASEHPDVLRRLIEAGVDVLRLNFSHGTHAEKARQIEAARCIAADLERPIAILQDLQGPKIRVGPLRSEFIVLKDGARILLYGDERAGTDAEISVSYERLSDEVVPGDSIFLDDGMLELHVVATGPGVIEAEVIRGGRLTAHKGVNLPGVKLTAPALTPKDEVDLRFGLSVGIDMVALSFVRHPEDASDARRIIHEAGQEVPLIAKIEKREALGDIDRILLAFDGVMVARGDLGVELAHEKVPTAQRHIIRKANAIGKPVITATQMLETMTYNTTPTRAEASDVANAVLDGSDAVMLSGETAIGTFPVETVGTMARIIREAELEVRPMLPPALSREPNTNAFCSAAARLAADIGASALAALTRSGGTAQSLSSLRPHMPVFALCEREDIARHLNLWRGIIPLVINRESAIEEASLTIARELRSKALLPPGSDVVVVGVAPESPEQRTDFIRLITV
jgi:pyruvate kinase